MRPTGVLITGRSPRVLPGKETSRCVWSLRPRLSRRCRGSRRPSHPRQRTSRGYYSTGGKEGVRILHSRRGFITNAALQNSTRHFYCFSARHVYRTGSCGGGRMRQMRDPVRVFRCEMLIPKKKTNKQTKEIVGMFSHF